MAGRRHDAVQGHQGHGHGGRLPRAVHRPLAGQDQAGHGPERRFFRSRTGSPPWSRSAGNPNITDELLKGSKIGERTYKNHLDGYNQLDLLLGNGPSKRQEFFYFGGPHLGAVRIGDFKYQFYQQPQGWPGAKVTTDMPTIVNLRQDPFERTPSIGGQTLNDLGGGYMNDFYAREFWRFVLVQQHVAKLAADRNRLPADAGSGVVQSRRDQEEDRHHDSGTRGPVSRCPERRSTEGAGRKDGQPRAARPLPDGSQETGANIMSLHARSDPLDPRVEECLLLPNCWP